MGIDIKQKILDIPEIQSESIEEVAIDKARKAFGQIKQPLFINDSGWMIAALKGFPGPYMKYINNWFSPRDFLKLMDGEDDRTVTLRQVIVYMDQNTQKVFTFDSKGRMLSTTSGEGRSSDTVITFSKDDTSIAEAKEKGTNLLEEEKKLWESFSSWLKETQQV